MKVSRLAELLAGAANKLEVASDQVDECERALEARRRVLTGCERDYAKARDDLLEALGINRAKDSDMEPR